jgi:hypothetical protein
MTPYYTIEISGNRYTWSAKLDCSQEQIDAMMDDGVNVQKVVKVIDAANDIVANVQAVLAIKEAKRG